MSEILRLNPIGVVRRTGVLLFGGEEFIDLLTNFAFRNLDIILGLTIISHQGEETIVGDIELCNDD